MPKALRWENPTWTYTRDGVPGVAHFVSTRRARKLRKRGVVALLCGGGCYVWYEPIEDVENRKARHGARCYEMHRNATAGRVGRKYWLATQLAKQRIAHQIAISERGIGHYSRRLKSALVGPDTGLTEAEFHTYMQQGYALRMGGATPEDRAQRI